MDCVEGGASVSFMPPFAQAEAEAILSKSHPGRRGGERILLADLLDGNLVGTVQIVTALPPNQPHRAEIAKMLVLRSARAPRLGRRADAARRSNARRRRARPCWSWIPAKGGVPPKGST